VEYVYQKGVYYAGIKIFNNLPMEIKSISENLKRFKTVLRYFLNTHSFYTVDAPPMVSPPYRGGGV
jgi:hypothetical protein